jgi:ATP-dependent DNA helicase 2 subunit 2
VAPDEKVKGYKYGKTLVPFSMVDEAVLKYEAAKCLQLIGFTSAKNVPRTRPRPTQHPIYIY